ncbi:hypothetical protein M0813_04499 [Anaeramoeba flamelloides]|uniref:Uncharacterized protein n=1 Tax=Anaeramoeba flamelloides TaxID=1746091 RepID=A0ABQ8XMT6_9EUKA|nr:hypothetical protein M0813_04499 [Anaeramoeba flamelloides]
MIFFFFYKLSLIFDSYRNKTGKISFECEFKTLDNFEFWGFVNFFLIKVKENYLYQLLVVKIQNPENQSQNSNNRTQSKSNGSGSDSGSAGNSSGGIRKNNIKKAANFSTIFLSDGETEENFDDEITSMKESVRSLSNTKFEQKIIDKINLIEVLFENALETKNAEILYSIECLKNERAIQRRKYNELETLLQRRLTGLETEKMTMKNMSCHFSVLDQKKKLSTKLLKQYLEINDKIMKIFSSKTNEELNEIEKTLN